MTFASYSNVAKEFARNVLSEIHSLVTDFMGDKAAGDDLILEFYAFYELNRMPYLKILTCVSYVSMIFKMLEHF